MSVQVNDNGFVPSMEFYDNCSEPCREPRCFFTTSNSRAEIRQFMSQFIRGPNVLERAVNACSRHLAGQIGFPVVRATVSEPSQDGVITVDVLASSDMALYTGFRVCYPHGDGEEDE